MKRVVLLAVLGVAAVVVWSCRGDRVIEAPPSLAGDYEGWYIYKHGTTPPESMCVTVRFTQEEFHMRRDTVKCPDRPRAACDADGKYNMTAAVVIYAEDAQDSNATAQICVLERAPFASYVFSQPAGKLILESKVGSGDAEVTRKLDLGVIN